jgi:hypothetical protein
MSSILHGVSSHSSDTVIRQSIVGDIDLSSILIDSIIDLRQIITHAQRVSNLHTKNAHAFEPDKRKDIN